MNTTTAALEATGTLACNNGIVTLTLTSGETYTAKDGSRHISTLDRKMGNDGWKRSGYRIVDGAMTANLTRSKILADYVASR